MKQGKRRLLLLLLLLAALLLTAWLLLPTLIRGNIANRLNEAGLTLEQFETGGPGLNETLIRKAVATAPDGSRYSIGNLRASYRPGMLLSGRLLSIEAESLHIQPSGETQPLSEVLQALFGLMRQDMRSRLPLERLEIDRIRFALGDDAYLDASLDLRKENRKLQAHLLLETPDKPHLRFTQQEPGRWLLEAANREEDAFAGARYDGSSEHPLIFSVESDLVRLRQWATLFGIPFPDHNADTTAVLRLKPDFDNRKASFTITGMARNIDEPHLRITRAETGIKGTLQWQDDAADILIRGDAELKMQQLERTEMQADRLDFRTSGELRLTPEGLSGSFSPGMEIETGDFRLGELTTEAATLLSDSAQAFRWREADEEWRFGDNSFRAELGKTRLAGLLVEDGDYRLTHGAWRFPLAGETDFSLEGTSSRAGNGSFEARSIEQATSVSIIWPGKDRPLRLKLDIDATAAGAEVAGTASKQLGIKGSLVLDLKGEETQIAIASNARLQAGGFQHAAFELSSAQCTIVEPLSLTMTADGMAPVLNGERVIRLLLGAKAFKAGDTSGSDLHLDLDGRLTRHEPGGWRLAADTESRAAGVVRGDSRLGNIRSNGSIGLEVDGETTRLSLQPGYSVRLATLDHAGLQVADAELALLEQQQIRMPADGGIVIAGGGALKIDHAGMVHPDFRLQAGSLELRTDEAADTRALTGTLSTPTLVVEAADTEWKATGVEASFSADTTKLALDGSLKLETTGSSISYQLTRDSAEARGELAFQSKSQGIRSLSRTLRRLGVAIPRELQLLSGTARLEGKADWSDKLDSITTNIRLNRTGGRFGEAYFSGLNSSFDLALYPEVKGSSRSFSIPVVDLGIPITKLRSRVSVSKAEGKQPVFTLRRLRANMFGGTVSGNRVRLDMNRRSNSFTLAFRNVSLAEMVRLQQFEEIDAVGRLSGTLPITVSRRGISIRNGKAEADKSGGYIRYRPKDGGAALKSASSETEMLLKALDDYRYNELKADAAYKPDGQLTLQLKMKGKSPGLHETRPLHLNLNLDQNILSLIRSLRAVNGLNDKIDRAVKNHFKARNR